MAPPIKFAETTTGGDGGGGEEGGLDSFVFFVGWPGLQPASRNNEVDIKAIANAGGYRFKLFFMINLITGQVYEF
jgi:hypothetical protein